VFSLVYTGHGYAGANQLIDIAGISDSLFTATDGAKKYGHVLLAPKLSLVVKYSHLAKSAAAHVSAARSDRT
jgi:hypothetical protein